MRLRKQMNRKTIYPAATMFLLLILWEMLVRILSVPSYVLPKPTSVLAAMWNDRQMLLGHSSITVMEALGGMGISLVCALILGILMDANETIKSILYPILVVTQTVPMIVLSPILILYLGFGIAPKILTVVLMCFFPIVVSFADGMGQLDPAYANLVRSYGGTGLQVYTQVKIPYSMPSLLSGLKVAATYSISGAVVGEWIASQSGLGYYLLRVKNSYALDKMFACVIVIVLLSLLMNGLIYILRKLFLPYLNKRK
ncbi:MAG: ABC transporter permease [Christensenellales bacterium]|nr:ABC transporter permease [Christensenellales bacterium]